MSEHKTTEGVYGPGTYTDTEFISVPEDSRRLLKHLASITPGFTNDPTLLDDVEFTGGDLPIIPGPIKAQVLFAVIHAMIGITSREILATKDINPGKIKIDTDQAGLYPSSASLVAINGRTMAEMAKDHSLSNFGKDLDKGCMHSNPMRHRGWAIYPTKEKNVWYQIMSNMAPYKFFSAYGLDADAPAKTNDEAYELIKSAISKYSARELEQKNMEHGFCGQTCLSPTAWRETLMGQALARHPLIDYSKVVGTADVPPVPFPITPGDSRPLAGIRVVEFARVIAGPALGAVLTSLGAEVLKVQSPNLPDPNVLQLSLTAGKYTCSVDLTKEADRQIVQNALTDADVIIQAFRLRSLEHKGFGLADMVEMARKRNKGIVYLDLNCYGLEGTYAERPGFQQIADAASGCSYVIGKAYGFEEGTGVLPSLPIADMATGAVGALEVLLALRDRAKHGGSYHGSAVLVSANTVQLTQTFGLYSPEVVQKIQDTMKFAQMTPDLHVEDLLGVVLDGWRSQTNVFSRQEFFSKFANSPFGKDHTILGPVVKFENEASSPYWNHSPVPFCSHEKVGWGLDEKVV